MSDGEFIVPTENTDNKTIMIVGIVVSRLNAALEKSL